MWPRSSKSPADPGRPMSVTRWPARARAAEKTSPSEPVPTIEMRSGRGVDGGPGPRRVGGASRQELRLDPPEVPEVG